jgi:endonuclease YncB( thermonuclease family)
MRRLTLLFALAALLAALAPAAADAAKRHRCLPYGSLKCFMWTGKATFVADGDTIYVDVDGDGSRRSFPVRITGINAMEQTTYTSRASQRRGECHAVEATARLDQLLKGSRYKVRLLAQDPDSRSFHRLRRTVYVRHKGRWIDVARTLLAEGHVLWFENWQEIAWNRDYSILQGRAMQAGQNLWSSGYCGFGPNEGQPIQMLVNWDADGDDALDPDGEWVRIKNLDPVNPLPLGGWWLRDAGQRRYRFPGTATVAPGGYVTVYVGDGDNTDDEFYWRMRKPQFANVSRDARGIGDGAYLFDPQGDVRASFLYPCRENCFDPNAGALALDVTYRGKESVRITNTGAAPIDLEPYRLVTPGYGYSFAPGSVVQPGQTMRVRIYESEDDDSALIRYWTPGKHILDNGGDIVQLRRYDDVLVGCFAWGRRSC